MGFSSPTTNADELRTKLQQMMIRKAAKYKANAALLQARSNCGNSLVKKMVVAQICVRIKRNRSKKNHTRLAQRVCCLHRNFKRRIIERPLCPLHPVDNAAAVRVGFTCATDNNTSVRAQPIKVLHL